MTAEKAPPDAHLEKLMNDVQRTGQALLGHDTVRIVPNMAELARANDAARQSLREYLSERTRDTQRLDWVIESGAIVDESNRSAEDGEPWQCTILNGGFGTRSDFFWGATPREVIDKARRASTKEPAE